VRVLLDTVTFVRAYEGGLQSLPAKARRALLESQLVLSTISLVEIAIKSTLSRSLHFPHEAIEEAIRDMRLTVLAYTPAHARRLFALPLEENHRDPFDRMLIAAAIEEELPIVTSDRQFSRYRSLQVIWR
jgi:PIN domain nuclease of toxin-antitoxin system